MINWEKILLNAGGVFLITLGGISFTGVPETEILKGALFTALFATMLATGLELKREADEEQGIPPEKSILNQMVFF